MDTPIRAAPYLDLLPGNAFEGKILDGWWCELACSQSLILSGTARGASVSVQPAIGAIRGEAPTIERSGDFLAPDGWKTEAPNRIVVHGGCGSKGSGEWIGVNTNP